MINRKKHTILEQRGWYASLIILIAFSSLSAQKADRPLYKDASQAIEKRVADLLSRMTLEEKIGQMCQYVGLEHQRKTARMRLGENVSADDAHAFYKNLSPNDQKELIKKGRIGSFLHVTTAMEANELQHLAQESRLQIPLLIGIDAIHGNALVRGATVYPTPLALASTWQPELLKKIGRETAAEMRALGMHWTFTPNVDIARDPRWGRVGETFGEDPYLVSRMGVAMIKGLQEGSAQPSQNVIACAKHFVGGGQSVNGLNSAPTDVSRLTLYQLFFPPFKAAIDAGAYTVMAAHNEIEGQPCHASSFLLNDILRGYMGFTGFVVSDWMDMERVYNLHHVTATMAEAYRLSVQAGVDMHMHGPGFFEDMLELVKNNRLSEKRIDAAVRAILKAKFEIGLFEQPFVDEKSASRIVFNPAHRQTALQAAREAVILLKNDGILPLDPSEKLKIFVTGPNADNQTVLGDWALQQPEENVITVLEGLKSFKGLKADIIHYDCGSNIRKMEAAKIDTAARMAAKADLSIVVVGSNSLRYLPDFKTSGENVDRAHINLAGRQLELLQKIHAAGKPLIVVYINSRPLAEPWIDGHADAIIEAWEPGAFGGQALAEIIFGKINPSGKLPVTIPRSEGQIVMTYNHKPSNFFHTYLDEPTAPLYPFGFGLSYTDFELSGLKFNKTRITENDTLVAALTLQNTGRRAGSETVQLYLRDEVSSLTRPVKELIRFQKVFLNPGEKKTVRFKLHTEDLGFYDGNGAYLIEPGWFTLYIGNSSADNNMLEKRFELVQ